MTSKIVVNNIESDTGVSTVTIASPVALSGGITGTGFAVGTGASISSPATNILTVSTNNAERIRVGAAGSIGIGTDNPLGVLAVSGGVSNPAITFQNGSATNTASDAAVGSIVGYSRTTGGNINIGSVDIRTDTASASSGAVRVLTALNGSLAERLRVDSSGRFTIPYQPSFFAYVAGNDTTTADATIIVFDGTVHNIGSHYSTSTGRFTAPVTGVYVFHAQIWAKNGTGYSRAIFRVAGSQATQNGFHPVTVGNNNDHTFQMSMVRYVSAGDAVDVVVNLGPLTYYGGGSGSPHTYFCGYLVG